MDKNVRIPLIASTQGARNPTFPLAILLPLALLLLLAGACTTTQKPVGFKDADLRFQKGEYARALVNYQISLSQGSPNQDQEWAKYRIAACLYEMKAYIDANQAIETYLSEHPQGRYLPEIRQLMRKIAEEEAQKREQQRSAVAELLLERRTLQEQILRNPQDAHAHYRLADVFWRLGDYPNGAKHYREVIRLDSRYETDPTLVKRVRLTDAGAIEPRVPTVGTDLFGNEGPLHVVDTQSAVLADYDERRDRRIFVVSGRIENHSIRSYRQVALHVMLRDLQGALLGSRVKDFRVIPGGEHRDFRLTFPILGTVMNVSRYECRLIYDHGE
jgi:tetratricopeptide (TPR) repeat protein